MAAAPVASISATARLAWTASPKPTPPSTMRAMDERAVMRRAASAISVSVSSASETASWKPSAPPLR